MQAQMPPRIPLVPASSILPQQGQKEALRPSIYTRASNNFFSFPGAPQLLGLEDMSLDGTLCLGCKDAP